MFLVDKYASPEMTSAMPGFWDVPRPLQVRYPLRELRTENSCSQPVFPRSVSKDSTMCHTSRCAWQHRETLQCSWDGLYCSCTVLPAALWIDRSDAGMMGRIHILMYCICSRAWQVLRRFYCRPPSLYLDCSCSRILERGCRVVARAYVCVLYLQPRLTSYETLKL